jgi:hypothetical protein
VSRDGHEPGAHSVGVGAHPVVGSVGAEEGVVGEIFGGVVPHLRETEAMDVGRVEAVEPLERDREAVSDVGDGSCGREADGHSVYKRPARLFGDRAACALSPDGSGTCTSRGRLCDRGQSLVATPARQRLIPPRGPRVSTFQPGDR